MFFHKTDTEKADLLGLRLGAGGTETAKVIMEELGKRFNVRLPDGNNARQFTIEVVVFTCTWLIASLLPISGRCDVPNSVTDFVVAVATSVLAELSTEGLPDALSKTLFDTYNRRQRQYVSYKALVPAKNEPLKDTLYWEFSKIIFRLFEDQNPATLAFLNYLVGFCTKTMLDDVLKVREVFES